MGKSNFELALCLVLIAACGLKGNIECDTHIFIGKKNWTQARLFCQTHYVDLATLEMINMKVIIPFLVQRNTPNTWIGLLRDPEDDSFWKSINLRSVSILK